MPRIIFTSRYLNAAPKSQITNLVEYIATRENVDKSLSETDMRPATEKQMQTIGQLLETAPHMKKSLEYADYVSNPTMVNASELISETISQNLDLFAEKENFVEYMAKRPGAERHGAHGLFNGGDEPIDLKAVQAEAANHKGRLWTHVVSLRREDAERLGFNNAVAWKSVVQDKAELIAKSMRIEAKDLKWYAAFHNESHHPHIHLLVYSANPKKGYLTEKGIEKMRSAFANEIFHQDLEQLYIGKTEVRNELIESARKQMNSLMDDIQFNTNVSPQLENMIAELSVRLSQHKGRKMYGYLKADDKKLVDDIVRELAGDERIGALYKEWCKIQDDIFGTYKDKLAEHIPLWEQEVFKPIKNAVIDEVANHYDGNVFADTPDAEPDIAVDIEDEEELVAAAEKGDQHAQYKLGKLYIDENTSLYDTNYAIHWFTESAMQGNQFAQYSLGKLLYDSNIAKSVEWLTTSANQGNQYAQYALGKHYYYERDMDEAVSWFMKSAEQGNEYAQKMLDFIANGGHGHANTSAITLLYHLSRMIQNRYEENNRMLSGQTEKKLLRKIAQKKENHGQRMD